MDSLSLSERVLNVIDELESGDTLEIKVIRLAELELRHRLARYQFTDRRLQAKYGMTLEEFEARHLWTR